MGHFRLRISERREVDIIHCGPTTLPVDLAARPISVLGTTFFTAFDALNCLDSPGLILLEIPSRDSKVY